MPINCPVIRFMKINTGLMVELHDSCYSGIKPDCGIGIHKDNVYKKNKLDLPISRCETFMSPQIITGFLASKDLT